MVAIHKLEIDKNIQGDILSHATFSRKRAKNIEELKSIMRNQFTNYDTKSRYIDERIEEDIQYFALNYSQV